MTRHLRRLLDKVNSAIVCFMFRTFLCSDLLLLPHHGSNPRALGSALKTLRNRQPSTPIPESLAGKPRCTPSEHTRRTPAEGRIIEQNTHQSSSVFGVQTQIIHSAIIGKEAMSTRVLDENTPLACCQRAEKLGRWHRWCADAFSESSRAAPEGFAGFLRSRSDTIAIDAASSAPALVPKLGLGRLRWWRGRRQHTPEAWRGDTLVQRLHRDGDFNPGALYGINVENIRRIYFRDGEAAANHYLHSGIRSWSKHVREIVVIVTR